ncbi:hypothetical protein [Micromonospora aurantiaca (nom. illeg.)]|uniref:hypothetical protein n=1 Tax=Micromonospora aurantiaca (nom. illeg.) TaxID=47850 RepID=UPI001656B3B0|nr:hypothetical protein [Micromonospora aurantiaca]MBC9005081.1 hypothetical protein [Micromonospora aurantiaca]
MSQEVKLTRHDAEDALRMLTALSAILHAPPLPERLFETLEPAIGSEIIRYGNPIGVSYLRERVDELRALLVRGLGDRLLDEGLRANPPHTTPLPEGS